MKRIIGAIALCLAGCTTVVSSGVPVTADIYRVHGTSTWGANPDATMLRAQAQSECRDLTYQQVAQVIDPGQTFVALGFVPLLVSLSPTMDLYYRCVDERGKK